MDLNQMHLARLNPVQEEQVRSILRVGSEKVLSALKEPQREYEDDPLNHMFKNSLEVIAETLANVAGLSFFSNERLLKNKRISFLPGYVMKSGKRLTYKVLKDNSHKITSDLVFSIDEDGNVDRINGISNRALLYDACLHQYSDGDNFIVGGTHQYLVANEIDFRTPFGYQLDVLQISTDTKKESSETTTIFNIHVNFTQQKSCKLLYTYLKEIFDGLRLSHRWPYNYRDEDKLTSRVEETYQMRGYLVALWYKILFDKDGNKMHNWIDECKSLALENNFQKLSMRLEALKRVLSVENDEIYNNWYSIKFDSMPDFTGRFENEPFGSATILTNFTLTHTYFNYVKPWLSLMYQYFRQYENTAYLDKKASLLAYIGEFQPRKVCGGMWTNKSYRFLDPIQRYYQACIEREHYREIFMQKHHEAIDALKEIAKASFYYNGHSLHLKMINTLSNQSSSFVSDELVKNFDSASESLMKMQLRLHYDVVCGLATLDTSLDLFCDKIFGRLISAGCHICLDMSWAAINSLLTRNKMPNFSALDSKYKNTKNDGGSKKGSAKQYIARNFYFFGMTEDFVEPERHKKASKWEVWDGLSKFEKSLLRDWLLDTWKLYDTYTVVTEAHRQTIKEKIRKSLPSELREQLS